MGYQWKIQDTNFDNIGSAMLTLFVLGTLESWPIIMYNALDGDDEKLGPTYNTNFILCLYFISFIFIGSFFFLNLFVGAICYHFDKCHKNEKCSMFDLLTEEQIKWIEM